jgi:hypothetical protein
MCWASNDSRVVSAGADGAVYEWRLSDMRREKENVLKGCQYRWANCCAGLRLSLLHACGAPARLTVVFQRTLHLPWGKEVY